MCGLPVHPLGLTVVCRGGQLPCAIHTLASRPNTSPPQSNRWSGARAYLLGEMEDFWALADLTDLSKGALATLPQWLSKVEADLTALSAL